MQRIRGATTPGHLRLLLLGTILSINLAVVLARAVQLSQKQKDGAKADNTIHMPGINTTLRNYTYESSTNTSVEQSQLKGIYADENHYDVTEYPTKDDSGEIAEPFPKVALPNRENNTNHLGPAKPSANYLYGGSSLDYPYADNSTGN